MSDHVHLRWVEPDDYSVVAEPAGPLGQDVTLQADLAAHLAEAPPEAWGRMVLAVAAMHEPDDTGQCRYCRPDRHRWRWWRRLAARPCPTRRMLLAEASSIPPGPSWMPA
ncbi:MAG TPA: hypothetical protein VFX70_02635 [Mycobacteriales bacterium]|nr:hypothetical protein [Mycobacteriales bacterium]